MERVSPALHARSAFSRFPEINPGLCGISEKDDGFVLLIHYRMKATIRLGDDRRRFSRRACLAVELKPGASAAVGVPPLIGTQGRRRNTSTDRRRKKFDGDD